MNDIYEKNIETIESINKDFANNLKLSLNKEHNNIEIINNKNFLVKIGSKEILAYPKNHENDMADETFKDVELYNDECSVLIGAGNGYLLKKILKKSEKKHIVLLIEPIYKLLNNLLQYQELSTYIKTGKLIMCTGGEELPLIFSFVENSNVVQMWHTVIDNYTILLPDIYKKIIDNVRANVNQIMCNTGTVMGAGAIIAENDIKNLPYVIDSRGVNEIKNLYKNKPAIVILSAPTVTKLIPQLLDKNIRKKIIIIAIAQMLRPLLAFGIKPDFICSVDYGKVNYEHFDNLWHIKDVPFVALNRTYAPILEKWQGPKFISASFNYADENTAVTMLNEKGSLEQGGSVGHMALGLGIHLGCNPIIHIGFDCAYGEDGLSHNTLGDAVGKVIKKEDGTLEWKVDDPNSILRKKNNSMGGSVYVPGYFNQPVLTNAGLASFITAMDNLFKKYTNIKFINSCEGGAKKQNCEQMSLKLALKKYCKYNINKKKINEYLKKIPDEKIAEDIEDAKKRLEWEIKLFKDVIKECDKAISPLNEMLKADNKELDKLFAINAKHSIEAQNLTKKSNLLTLHIYKTNREIHNRKLKVEDSPKHLKKDKKDLSIRIDRSKLILTATKNSAKRLIKIYKEVLIVLSTYWHKKRSTSEIKINPKTWNKLIKNNNWARPLLELEYMLDNNIFIKDITIDKQIDYYNILQDMKEKTIKEGLNREDLTKKIEYLKYLDLSKEAGKKLNYKLALKYIKTAMKYSTKDDNILLWGMATSYNFLGKYKKALKIYKKLTLKDPVNLRYQFEEAQIWLVVDMYKGLCLLDNIMKKTNEFDSFYLRMAELTFGINEYKRSFNYINKYLTVYPHSIDGKKLLNNIKEKIK